jgi:prevent-host-death family protein
LRNRGSRVGLAWQAVAATALCILAVPLTLYLCATKMEHMRTATVRDLRNRYLSLLRWIRAGEEIVITRRGKPVARLVPEPDPAADQIDWSQSPAFRRDRSTAVPLTAEESATILREAGGGW